MVTIPNLSSKKKDSESKEVKKKGRPKGSKNESKSSKRIEAKTRKTKKTSRAEEGPRLLNPSVDYVLKKEKKPRKPRKDLGKKRASGGTTTTRVPRVPKTPKYHFVPSKVEEWKPGIRVQYQAKDFGLKNIYHGTVIGMIRPESRFVRVSWDDGSEQYHAKDALLTSNKKTMKQKVQEYFEESASLKEKMQ